MLVFRGVYVFVRKKIVLCQSAFDGRDAGFGAGGFGTALNDMETLQGA